MSQRARRLQAHVGAFIHEYGSRGGDNSGGANDRKYDRGVERLVKRLPPEDLDELMRGEYSDIEGPDQPSSPDPRVQ